MIICRFYFCDIVCRLDFLNPVFRLLYQIAMNIVYCIQMMRGILLTLVDNRTNLAKSTIDALRENFGSYIKIYNSQIPIAIKAAEVSSKGKSIYAYEPNSTVSKAYTEFSKEVLADGRKKERLHSAQVR